MAGAGYKLFTTGQVLTAAEVNTYLQEQTVMVFNDAASRTTALSGVLAEGMVSYLKSTKVVEIYNGTAWASLDDPNAIQNTIVDAKGDLITATGNDVPARLAVGNNGETLVADSSTSTGLRWQTPKSVNYLLNSDMSIWQRGTSIAAATSVVYGADRWSFMRTALGTGATMSRQTSTNTGFQYAMRIQRDSGNTSTEQIAAFQPLESSQSIPLAGKTVTLSFWARAGANFSATNSVMSATLTTGTGTDQSPNTWRFGGWTSQTTVINISQVITTSWVRYQTTATLGSSITQVGIGLGFIPVGTAGANDWVEVTGVQLEIGSIATQFQTATGTLAGELAAAQRYYVRWGGQTIYESMANANCPSTTAVSAYVIMPVEMRVPPTSIDANALAFYDGQTVTAVSSPSFNTNIKGTKTCQINWSATGLTQYRYGVIIANNSSAAFLGLSAEL